MSCKSIHIVFQILNAIKDSSLNKYNLLPIDKLILIILASHQGVNGIFPSQQTLAFELDISVRYIRERIKILQSIGLISIIKVKRSYHYKLENLSTGITQIEEPQFLSQRNHSSPNRGTTVPTNNKVSNKRNKIERERAALAPPSLSFSYEQNIYKLLIERHLDFNVMHEKFLRIAKMNGKKYADQNAAFENFIMNEKQTIIEIQTNVIPIVKKTYEPAKCDKCKEDVNYCSCEVYATKEVAQDFIQKIKKGLKGNFINNK